MARKVFEQLDHERRRETYEKKRLNAFSASKAADLSTATFEQLRAAALLADHEDWDLSRVGRAAIRELKRRGHRV